MGAAGQWTAPAWACALAGGGAVGGTALVVRAWVAAALEASAAHTTLVALDTGS